MEEDEVLQKYGFGVTSKISTKIELQHSRCAIVQVVEEDIVHDDDCQRVFPYFPEFAVVRSKHFLSWNGDLPHS